jgi:hypothetical protein
MKQSGKRFALVLACIAIFGMATGITGAFLSKSVNELENVITSGDVAIRLTEPDWESETGDALVPRETVAKNPMVTNTGKNDAWVYLQVQIPIRTLSVVDPQTKKKEAPARYELFEFEADASWELLDRSEEEDQACYVYAYHTLLKPGETTSALFNSVSLINVLEGELEEQEPYEIPIQAAAIQGNAGASTEKLWEIYQSALAQDDADAKEE